jgi:MFS family permease
MLQTSPSNARIFQHADMRLVIPARALSYFGDSLALIVLSLKIAETDRPTLMTLMMIAFALPLFVLAPISGRLVDEYDSRLVLVGAGALQVVASLGLVLSGNVAAILGFVLLLQVGQSVSAPAWGALVPRIVGPELIGKAIGLQQSLAGLAGLGGAAAAGVLYDVLGYHLTLAIDTATFATLVAVAALVKTRRGRRYDAAEPIDSQSPAPIEAAQSGWQFIKGDALLRLLFPALWLFVLSAEATNVVEVFLIRDDLGATAAVYGAVIAAFMLGQIAGPLLAGRVRGEPARVVWTAISAAVIGALVIAIGVSPTVWIVLPLFVVVGVAGGALNALLATVLVTRTPDHVRGQVLAALSGTSRGFSVLAMVLGGLSGQLLGARPTFVICGALSVFVSLIVLRTRRAAAPGVSPQPVQAATIVV